jgi:hypothetical protein
MDNDLEYVSSFCPPETVLISTDKLYVHASPEWAAGVIAFNRRANENAAILQKAWKRHCKGGQLHRRLPWRIQVRVAHCTHRHRAMTAFSKWAAFQVAG